jgi:phosphomannomutase
VNFGNIDPDIFKPYDIRGIVPDQLTAEIAEQVGRAFAAFLKPKSVVVGRDVRLTSKEFQNRAIKGLIYSGVDVVDIGQVSTDVFYYACAIKNMPGLMVTASHNPKEYNGFKMMRKVPEPLLSRDIQPWITEKKYKDAPAIGDTFHEDMVDQFIDHLLSIVSPTKLKPLKIVVDTSNGAQGPIWERLIPHLPVTVKTLYFEPDGNFPNHINDIVQPPAQEALRKAVIAEKADLGLIFDPDGDRCLAVDNSGETVPGDFLTALISVSLLKRQPGSVIVYDIKSSDAVSDMVTAAGGKPYAWKSGHAFIKPKMAEFNAIFGGELSGHYFFRDFWFLDCGLLSGLIIMEYISGLKGSLSDVLKSLRERYYLSGEINSAVDDVNKVLVRIKSKYKDGKLNELDGVAIRYPDWHFVVRPSANEPLLRMTLEANSQELMERKRDELLALIRS